MLFPSGQEFNPSGPKCDPLEHPETRDWSLSTMRLRMAYCSILQRQSSPYHDGGGYRIASFTTMDMGLIWVHIESSNIEECSSMF